jgi:uncharacterized protein (DUF2147 family)
MLKFFSLTLFLLSAQLVLGQKEIIGIWKNTDDEDGKEKSHIEIYESQGKLKARIIKLLPAAESTICSKCSGNNKNKPLEGMEIMWGLTKTNEKEYSNGEILNPKNGKIYSCNITLETPTKLKIRGFLGFSFIGKTQYWYRVK